MRNGFPTEPKAVSRPGRTLDIDTWLNKSVHHAAACPDYYGRLALYLERMGKSRNLGYEEEDSQPDGTEGGIKPEAGRIRSDYRKRTVADLCPGDEIAHCFGMPIPWRVKRGRSREGGK